MYGDTDHHYRLYLISCKIAVVDFKTSPHNKPTPTLSPRLVSRFRHYLASTPLPSKPPDYTPLANITPSRSTSQPAIRGAYPIRAPPMMHNSQPYTMASPTHRKPLRCTIATGGRQPHSISACHKQPKRLTHIQPYRTYRTQLSAPPFFISRSENRAHRSMC
jgi:hypothetical protein